MDSEYGTGTNVKHPRRNTTANGNIGEVRNPVAAFEDERGKGRYPRIHQGIPVREAIVAPAKRLKSFSSGSSSASDSSSEDFIQVDPKLINLRASATAPSPNHVRPLPIYYKTDLSSNTSSKSEVDSRLSTGDSSQVSGITHESLSQSPSVTESPPIQVMERPSGFDPDRIPPSVFASKSPSPMEWSVASNESLFSIHIGNNSFSRDRVLKLSGELHKSGELEKSSISYISDISFNPSPPVAQRKESDRRKFNTGRDFEETEKPMIETPVKIAGDQSKQIFSAQEMSFNHHPDGSELHIETVVFPEKKKHEKSSGSSSNCSCGLCCSTWPSCCLCKWPSCNCCAWPSCNCCKWPRCSCCKLPSCNSCCRKPSCSCCKWPSCSSCCKWPSCSICCKWPSCSGCSQPSCSYCKWSSCSCCKWPSCSGCCKPSCTCCKWPSFSGCRKPSCSCCKWPSCSCCQWPSCSCSAYPSCSGCSWAYCCCWNSRRKKTTLIEGRHAEVKSSRRWYSCFLCCSSPC